MFKSLLNLLPSYLYDTDNMKKLDLTNDDDYATLKEQIADIKKSITDNSFLSSFIGTDFIDDIAQKIDEYRQEKLNENELLVTIPERPSDKLTEKEKNRLHGLATEYIHDYLEEYFKDDTEKLKDIHDCLFEYSAWILKK